FIPSAGNGIFNATPTNTVPVGFSPLPGAIVNGNLVLPNPGGNSLGFLSLSAALFGSAQPPISFAAGEFDRPIGIDGSTDLNGDGFFDLLVANNGNGSISLLLGGSNSFDFSTAFFLNEITNASALQVAGFELYVTQEGQELFTVFDLANLRLENNGPIPSFEEISGEAADSVASTNRPIGGLGRFAPLLLALFGQFPLEEGETGDDEGLSNEPASWQSLVLIVTQVTQQFDRLSEEIGNRLLVSMLDSLSTDWGLPKLTNSQATQLTFETLVLPLGVLTGTQPVTQLVRTLRRLWPQRPNAPANRPAGSSTPPATKTPVIVPMKAVPAQSSAIPENFRSRSRETSVRTLTSPATSGTSAVSTSHDSEATELTKYMAQLATNPTVASELFDRQSLSSPEVLFEPIADNFGTEAAAGWPVFVWSALVSPAMAELGPRRLRNRHSQKMIVG
ncbi:MAG: FG-GAP repeat domain-containing protein, partial [Planctomycetaceae bacterium]